MVKNRVMLSGLLVAGFMGTQTQANDYVDRAKAPIAFFAGASVVRNSAEWALGKVGITKPRNPGLGFPVGDYTAQTQVVHSTQSTSYHTARMLRVGSYSVGLRTPDGASWKETLMGARPAVDGFTFSNIAKDALFAAALWHFAAQQGYVSSPNLPCPFAKR